MLKIREADPNLYFSDKKTEYVSLDALINKTSILAACINQAKPAKEPTKELVKQILHRYIEKKNDYAAIKKERFNK